MKRIDWNTRMTRGLMSSALAATLAFAGAAQAEGTQKSEAQKGDQHSTQTQASQKQAEPAKRAPALSGLSREQIKEVQRELAARGLYQGTIDGVSGAKTESALRNFQTQHGLPVGTMNAQTRDALGIDSQRQPVSGSASEPVQRQPVSGRAAEPVQRQPASSKAAESETATTGTQLSSLSTEQVKQIQQGLQRDGFYQGEVDGVMGAQTRASLRRYFQHQAQLADQGMVNKHALSVWQSK